MLDLKLRTVKERTLEPVASRLTGRVSPNALTAGSLLVTTGAAALAWADLSWLALVAWLLGRLLDGLDGPVARASGQADDLGGYLDIVGDTVGYAVLPLGVALGLDQRSTWIAVAVLEAVFFVNTISWSFPGRGAGEARRRGGGQRRADHRDHATGADRRHRDHRVVLLVRGFPGLGHQPVLAHGRAGGGQRGPAPPVGPGRAVSEPPSPSPWRRRLLVIGLWASAALAWLWYLHASDEGAVDTLQRIVDALRGAWWAIPAYVAIYAARPLLLFPASLLTIAGGIVFGPVVGIAVVLVASNLSAMVAYTVGRALATDPGDEDGSAAGADGAKATFAARWSTRMRERSFVTILVMRLAYLPYDLVNYAAGLLRIRPGAFLAATAIGSLPGTVSFVLAGSSIDRVDEGLTGFDPKVFAVSAVLFVLSLIGAKLLQRNDVIETVEV